MVSLDDIEEAIASLESSSDSRFSVYERLSILYTCRNELRSRETQEQEPETKAEDFAGVQMPEVSGSSFLDALSGKDMAAVMSVVDAHMQAVKAVFPREYDDVVAKLRAIQKA